MKLFDLYNSLLQEQLLLVESLTDIVYHFTGVENLINILNKNQFLASTALGHGRDFEKNEGYLYYFSTTRSKSTGFNTRNARLKLDGSLLNQRYKSIPVDWFYNKGGNTTRWTEMEDRIVLNKPSIDNAMNYITEISVSLEHYKGYQKKDILYIINQCKYNKIPLYFYGTIKDFLADFKQKEIDPLSLYKNYTGHSPIIEKTFSLEGIELLAALLSCNDKGVYNYIMKTFNPWEKTKQEIDDTVFELENNSSALQRNLYQYIQSQVNSSRLRYNEGADFLVSLLSKNMRRKGYKNLQDYIDFKTKVPETV